VSSTDSSILDDFEDESNEFLYLPDPEDRTQEMFKKDFAFAARLPRSGSFKEKDRDRREMNQRRVSVSFY